MPCWTSSDRAAGAAAEAREAAARFSAEASGAAGRSALLALPEFTDARSGVESPPLVASVAILLHVSRIADEYFSARAVEARGAGTGLPVVIPQAAVAPSSAVFVFASNLLEAFEGVLNDASTGGGSRRWLGACGCIAVSRILAANLRRVSEVRLYRRGPARPARLGLTRGLV